MRKTFLFVLAATLIVMVALAGCGGGGGGTSTPVDNDDGTGERTISGKVVSSESGSPGVANVIVKLGDGTIADGTTITDSTGHFEFKLSSNSASVPPYVRIDATGAGSNFSANYPITYKAQAYESTYITVPVDVRNDVTDDLGTYKLAYLGGDTPPWFPYASTDTILTGRIVRKDNNAAIQGVVVSFGNPVYTATTGKNGYFELNLGFEALVAPLLAGDKIFKIDTSYAGSEYPATLQVVYNGYTTSQSNILVPYNMYNETRQRDFGIIYVKMTSNTGDDPDIPPLPF